MSPDRFLKRHKTLRHIKKSADTYQSGTHKLHSEPIADTPAGEMVQENWTNPSPSQKGVESNFIGE